MPTIPSGTQATTYTISSADTYTLASGQTRTQTSGTGIQATVAGGSTTIDIEGTLNDTASGARAIRASVPAGQLTVGINGLVQSLNGDALQAQSATGRFDVSNAGQIISGSSIGTPTVGGTNPGTAYALNYNAALGATNAPATDYNSGGVITNGAVGNTTALIRSDSGDAIRLGSHQTLINYGTINGNGPVNDSSGNNTFNSTLPGGNGNPNTSTAQTYDISRGVRINQAGATSDRIDNYGTITGSQHGVDVGQTNVTGVIVNNFAGGQIIGRNGSGVGADTTGVAANTITVDNAGLIRGAYAPRYDRAGYTTIDGDGDGVDVDGGATVINRIGGVIEGTGAGGYDGNGRLNNSEGISLGGGIVSNAGTIRGAAYGIVVNNDSNPDGSRSGVAATQITNLSTGTITGQNGYAIRLENKTGSTADDDTITNYGTITGNGGIPTGTVLLQDASLDPNTVGTLDGQTYTSANAGSARFIRGDGSAIQTGEGRDTLSNYGTITGNSGRAINLEGGNDTLNLYTGSSITGRIDGGAGSDTLNLRLDDRTGADAALGANSGATTGTLANIANFETLSVQSGTWTLQDAQTYSAGIAINVGAGLTIGANGSLTGNVANAGTLAFVHTGDLTEAGAISGQGMVVQAGTGVLTLTGANTYTGGSTINAGTLELGNLQAAGTGAIAFASGAQTLQIDANGELANLLTNFARGDTIDLRGLAFTGASASYDAGARTLTVTSGGTTDTLHFDTNFVLPSGLQFTLGTDGQGGTNVTLAAIPSPDGSAPSSQPGEFGMTVTSSASPAGAVYGLYKALLGHTPDPLGLENFAGSIQNGATPADVAAAILASPEYAARNPNPLTDSAYVSSLYTSLLNRAPDAQGQAYFQGELSAGVSRATVASQIATSTEAQNVLQPTFANGVFVTNATDAQIARLYYGILGRTPDTNGLASFEAQAKGLGIAGVAQTMLSSSEFGAKFGNLSDSAYIDTLYVDALGHHADAAALSYWGNQLASQGRVPVAVQIAQSQEAQVHLVGVIEQGMQVTA